MKTILWCSVCLLFFMSCKMFRPHIRKENISGVARRELTAEQRQCLLKYGRMRKKVTDFLGLLPDASPEEIRQRVAPLLGLSPEATWEAISDTKLARVVCTEARRRRFVAVFGLTLNATWVELGFYVEAVWLRSRPE